MIKKTHTNTGVPKQTFIVFDTQQKQFYQFTSKSYRGDGVILGEFARENNIKFQKGEVVFCQDFKKVIT